MSDNESNAENEKALTADHQLATGGSQETVAQEPSDQQHSAKLVLTPDFRVSEAYDGQSVEGKADDAVKNAVQEAAAADDTPLEFHHTGISPEADSGAPQGTMPDDEDTPSLESTIAELEAAIGEQNDEWEGDGSDFEEDAEAKEIITEPVQDWVDSPAKDVEVEAPTAPVEESIETATITEEADAVPEDNAVAADLADDEETVIDEETLRDMIGEIVRQELQGVLGERITRNVRKLVRREINIVLSAQDLE